MLYIVWAALLFLAGYGAFFYWHGRMGACFSYEQSRSGPQQQKKARIILAERGNLDSHFLPHKTLYI
ncbi:hypothetical protein SXCC_01841 [Gluconacetobacter sp. SXCC-1]|nr:hypothetical protein SXCC_01841 [Gluconacetobacter sp. SXCC-1]